MRQSVITAHGRTDPGQAPGLRSVRPPGFGGARSGEQGTSKKGPALLPNVRLRSEAQATRKGAADPFSARVMSTGGEPELIPKGVDGTTVEHMLRPLRAQDLSAATLLLNSILTTTTTATTPCGSSQRGHGQVASPRPWTVVRCAPSIEGTARRQLEE
jgi:hypothetical protein